MQHKHINFPDSRYTLYHSLLKDMPESFINTCLYNYKNAYPNTKWDENFNADMAKDPTYSTYYLLDSQNNNEVAASFHLLNAFSEDTFADITQNIPHKKCAQLNSLYVNKKYRKSGLAKQLTESIIDHAFNELSYDLLIATSRHINALRLYIETGANLWQDDIDNFNRFCPVEDNRKFFKAFIDDPRFRLWKLEGGIRFYYKK